MWTVAETLLALEIFGRRSVHVMGLKRGGAKSHNEHGKCRKETLTVPFACRYSLGRMAMKGHYYGLLQGKWTGYEPQYNCYRGQYELASITAGELGTGMNNWSGVVGRVPMGAGTVGDSGVRCLTV